MSREKFARVTIHLLLAAFVALAANKFFIPNLQAEEIFGDYRKIFEFKGEAPDQYRILPLLALKALCTRMDFHHAVLIFNFVCAFFVLEILFSFVKEQSPQKRIGFSFLFSILFIYTQYTGWRPDSLALLLLCCLVCLWAVRSRPGWTRELGFIPLIAALAFSRSDMALAFAVFFCFFSLRSLWSRIAVLAVAPLVQLALQLWIFPDAEYYTKIVMLGDNLRGFYMVMNPATWLVLAAAVAFRKEIFQFIRTTFQKTPYIYFVFTGYLALVMVVGRINEYRLFLPFIPLFLLVHYYSDGKKKAGNF